MAIADPGKRSQAHRTLIACYLGIAFVAVGIVAFAFLTQNYVALAGLVALGGGAFGCHLAIRDETAGGT